MSTTATFLKTHDGQLSPRTPRCSLLMILTCAVLILGATSGVTSAQDSKTPIAAQKTSTGANPFQELTRFMAGLDQSKPRDIWKGVHEAYRLKLYGSSRRLARDLLNLDPDFAQARQYLGYQLVKSGVESGWLNQWDRTQKERGKFRHTRFGWINVENMGPADMGLIRGQDGRLISVEELNLAHNTWETRRTIETEYFKINSSLPLEVQCFVADDLERLATAYLDYYELPLPPKTQSQVNLYRTSSDAKLAGADAALLTRYGAYYYNGTLHVMFRSIGGLTALRHEAGHALNRAFATDLPQWLDEGIGVYCQFAMELDNGSLQFGTLPPNHAFGTKFLDKIKRGHRETVREILAESHVTMDSEHYSKFRAVVDFFMNAEGKKYRMPFLNLVFRKQGNLKTLADHPGIEQEWQTFLEQLEPAKNWRYLKETERTKQVQRTLEALPKEVG